MKDLNVRQATIKILEKNTGSNLFDLGHSKFLLNTSLETETKAKMNYWDFHQDKKLLYSKGNSQQKQKTTHRMGEDICKCLIRYRASIQNL